TASAKPQCAGPSGARGRSPRQGVAGWVGTVRALWTEDARALQRSPGDIPAQQGQVHGVDDDHFRPVAVDDLADFRQVLGAGQLRTGEADLHQVLTYCQSLAGQDGPEPPPEVVLPALCADEGDAGWLAGELAQERRAGSQRHSHVHYQSGFQTFVLAADEEGLVSLQDILDEPVHLCLLIEQVSQVHEPKRLPLVEGVYTGGSFHDVL